MSVGVYHHSSSSGHYFDDFSRRLRAIHATLDHQLENDYRLVRLDDTTELSDEHEQPIDEDQIRDVFTECLLFTTDLQAVHQRWKRKSAARRHGHG